MSPCGFWDDIGRTSIDPDGQELVGGDDRFGYLGELLTGDEDVSRILMEAPQEHNMLLLVFSYRDMNEAFEVTRSCERVKYHGGVAFSFLG